MIAEIERQTIALARALDVVGLMNVQFAIKDGEVYVLEVNPRASRTVPFVAKATGVPIAKIAARIMAGEKLAELLPEEKRRSRSPARGHVAVKEAVFPFARFPGVDLILGPEMRSTGEVMGLDADFGRAFAKAQLGSGTDLPLKGCIFVSVRDGDKEALIEPCQQLAAWGFELVATGGTARKLGEAGVPVRIVNKVQEGRPAYRRRDEERPDTARVQHDRGRAGDRRQLQPAAHRADPQYSLLHDCRRRARGGAGDRRAAPGLP